MSRASREAAQGTRLCTHALLEHRRHLDELLASRNSAAGRTLAREAAHKLLDRNPSFVVDLLAAYLYGDANAVVKASEDRSAFLRRRVECDWSLGTPLVHQSASSAFNTSGLETPAALPTRASHACANVVPVTLELPDTILCYALGFLGTRDLLCRTAAVSRHWLKLCSGPHVWNTLQVSKLDEALSLCTKRLPAAAFRMQKVCINADYRESSLPFLLNFVDLVVTGGRLEHMRLVNFGTSERPCAWSTSVFGQLRNLELDNSHVCSKLPAQFPVLQRLVLNAGSMREWTAPRTLRNFSEVTQGHEWIRANLREALPYMRVLNIEIENLSLKRVKSRLAARRPCDPSRDVCTESLAALPLSHPQSKSESAQHAHGCGCRLSSLCDPSLSECPALSPIPTARGLTTVSLGVGDISLGEHMQSASDACARLVGSATTYFCVYACSFSIDATSDWLSRRATHQWTRLRALCLIFSSRSKLKRSRGSSIQIPELPSLKCLAVLIDKSSALPPLLLRLPPSMRSLEHFSTEFALFCDVSPSSVFARSLHVATLDLRLRNDATATTVKTGTVTDTPFLLRGFHSLTCHVESVECVRRIAGHLSEPGALFKRLAIKFDNAVGSGLRDLISALTLLNQHILKYAPSLELLVLEFTSESQRETSVASASVWAEIEGCASFPRLENVIIRGNVSRDFYPRISALYPGAVVRVRALDAGEWWPTCEHCNVDN